MHRGTTIQLDFPAFADLAAAQTLMSWCSPGEANLWVTFKGVRWAAELFLPKHKHIRSDKASAGLWVGKSAAVVSLPSHTHEPKEEIPLS